jgi:hypothetical protein
VAGLRGRLRDAAGRFPGSARGRRPGPRLLPLRHHRSPRRRAPPLRALRRRARPRSSRTARARPAHGLRRRQSLVGRRSTALLASGRGCAARARGGARHRGGCPRPAQPPASVGCGLRRPGRSVSGVALPSGPVRARRRLLARRAHRDRGPQRGPQPPGHARLRAARVHGRGRRGRSRRPARGPARLRPLSGPRPRPRTDGPP